MKKLLSLNSNSGQILRIVIDMALGAAVAITIMTLATAHTLNSPRGAAGGGVRALEKAGRSLPTFLGGNARLDERGQIHEEH